MQTIEHKYKHELKTLNQVEKLYTDLSEYSVINQVKRHIAIDVPDGLTELVYLFYIYNNTPMVNFYHEEYTSIKPVTDDQFMIVCCSGGKDSVATAKLYIDRGYRVILYHMRGINPAYYNEFEAVKQIADILDVPYYIEKVKLKGKHQYIEHPMKNMLIANGAIQFCLDNNLPLNIAFGNYSSSKLADMDFEIDAGDSRDMWDIYERIIRNEISYFKIHTPLDSIKDTYEAFINGNINLLPKCISCMSPYRFRKHWKERTEKKYDVQLMNNRCGCCWKCCMEYMVLVDYHILSLNQEYYNHCFEILRNTALKETGHIEATVDQIWNRYFWYDISQSHLKYEI